MNDPYGVTTENPEDADYFYVPIFAACFVYTQFDLFDRYRFLVNYNFLFSDDIFPFFV